ncbi:MAG: DNA mismatch repair protein MutS [Alphaproteobacteria bacterium]
MEADEKDRSRAARSTPMMEQYLAIKADHPDHLLFYRMGDFYELFFADAEAASATLGIALTKRGKHLGEDIPMCGVPARTADDYLNKLIAAGHRVAVCDQTEDPAESKKRGNKSVVAREVVRLVTPGTITEDSLLDARSSSFLAGLARVREGKGHSYGLAWIDISTGEFHVTSVDLAGLPGELARIEPRELIVAEPLLADRQLQGVWRDVGAEVTPLPRPMFDSATAEDRLAVAFDVASIDSFGNFNRAEVAAAAAVLAYVERTQIKSRPSLAPPSRENLGGVMQIDAATRTNLELTVTLRGDRAGSLLAAVDRTISGAGSRLLAERIGSPVTDTSIIEARLDAVSFLLDRLDLRRGVRHGLSTAPDIARALARIAVDRGGPRDLAAIRDGLAASRELAGLLAAGDPPPPELAEATAALAGVPSELQRRLEETLSDDLPLLARDGGFVRPEVRAELDEVRALSGDGRRVIAGLQERYADESGIKNLKVKFNNVLGYFVEVASGIGDKMLAEPLSTRFIHRQTMAGALRFTTTELAEIASKIAGAGERAMAIELEVFDSLRGALLDEAGAIRDAANALARIDVSAGLAELAEIERYTRPIVDRSYDLAIKGGRHPVVEQALSHAGASFVANDCALTVEEGPSGRIWLVTGPNMAGKSTFLRQNALLAVLAQAGSFVPADAARIGVVDRLFSRVGAADDLARGRSTFMVEMVETAAILNQAGERSLVILDEIGRGTATFDGLSIAWATVEHLHDVNRCRALFATHFHELTALSQRLTGLHNATVEVKEWAGEVAFLHRIVPGAADRSYGIQVARLAGLPKAVVVRARRVLEQLEKSDRANAAVRLVDDLPLFNALDGDHGPADTDALRARITELELDEMTPREALEILYRLRVIAEEG